MVDFNKGWVISIFAGLEITHDWRINIIRLIFFFGLIFVYFIPASTDFSIDGCISFSVAVSLCIFCVKLILAVLNVIVNHTKSVPQNVHNTIQRNAQTNSTTNYDCENAPEGIPQELWDLRHEIPRDGPITETVFADLISRGFDPNVVIDFVKKIVPTETNEANESDDRSDQEMTKEVLEMCGREFTVPFNRKMIDSLFGVNYSFVYVFISFVFNFFMNLIATILMPYFPFYFRYWLSFIYGSALYSSIHPPDVDSYSTTRGDNYTGITRPFSIIILGGGYLFFLTSDDLEYLVEVLKFPFPASYMRTVFVDFFHIGLLLFPIWSVLFFGHPPTIINWLFEWVTRYLFGHSGATGLGNSIVLALRSTIGALVLNAILEIQYSNITLSSCCALTTFFLQVPTNCSFSCQTNMVQVIISAVVMSLLSFIGCYIGSENAYQSGSLLYDFSGAFTILFDVFYPYATAVNRYIFFTMRILKIRSKTINTLRVLSSCFFAPVVIGVVFTRNELGTTLTAFVILTCINKCMTEPHVFAIALLINRVTLSYEFMVSSQALGLFYAMMITRKLLSVFTVMDYWQRARLFYIAGKFEIFDTFSPLYGFRDFLILVFSLCTPFVDKTVSFVSLVWSVMTGSPFDVPQSAPFLLLPFPPRPNSFWNQVIGGNIDITRAYLQHRSDHPIETPVYSSMFHSLSISLLALIKSGRLGLVSSNSFFLFISEPLAAFVHIISLEPNAVRFQLRGLEYNDETLCHLGELAKLKDDVSSYRDFKPNFASQTLYYTTSWATRATGVKMWQYNVTKIREEYAFIGVDREDLDLWCNIAFAKNIRQRHLQQYNGETQVENEISENMSWSLSLFEFRVTDDNKSAINYVWQLFADKVFTDGSLDLDKLFSVFHGSTDDFFKKTAQSLVLYLSLASMQCGPDDETAESMSEFIKEVDRKYLVAPVQSAEFNNEFEMEAKDLVAYEETSDGRSLLFFRLTEVLWDVMEVQREVVRSYWASEAFLQIFLGEVNPERLSIQEDDRTMRNLIVQSSDIPIGYPAFVSPIGISYTFPTGYELF